MNLLALIVLFLVFSWLLKSIGMQIPGGGFLLSQGKGFLGKLFDGEKESGARFQNDRETNALLNARNTGVVLDGLGKRRLSDNSSFEHVAIISPTGAGKTTRYVAPNLLTLDNCSMVVTDPRTVSKHLWSYGSKRV